MLEFRLLIFSPAQSFHDCLFCTPSIYPASPGLVARLSKKTLTASLDCGESRFLNDEKRDELARVGLQAGGIFAGRSIVCVHVVVSSRFKAQVRVDLG